MVTQHLSYIHRDVKPENVLLSNGWHVTLCDFGCAIVVKEQQGRTAFKASFAGTAAYMPPEMIKQSESCYASEFWALGCTIYQMYTARTPFKGASDYQTLRNIRNGTPVLFPPNFPEPARDLIDRLLVAEPTRRLGYDSIEAIKQHKFFDRICWEKLSSTTPPPIGASAFTLPPVEETCEG